MAVERKVKMMKVVCVEKQVDEDDNEVQFLKFEKLISDTKVCTTTYETM